MVTFNAPRPTHLPRHESRWVIRHGKTMFGIHGYKMREGYDDECMESHVCLFHSVKQAKDVARILRSHRSNVGAWPSTDYDEGIRVKCNRVGTKQRPLVVCEVSSTVMETRLAAHGVKSVVVTDYLLDEGMLRMEVDACHTHVPDDDTLRHSLSRAFRMF